MDKQKLIYFNVPVALCQHVISKKLISPFKLYLYFKTAGNKFQIDNVIVQNAMKFLEISTTKTLDANLNKLIELNWIGFNPYTKNYFVRGFETLLYTIKAKYFIGVEFHANDFKTFRGFLAGAIFGYLSVTQLWNKRIKNKGMVKEPKGGGSTQLTTPPYFYPVAIYGVSEILSISLSTAHSFKELARHSKYISTKENLIPIDIDPMLMTGFLKTFPNLIGKVKISHGKVVQIGPTLVKSNMKFKQRKKTKHIMGEC